MGFEKIDHVLLPVGEGEIERTLLIFGPCIDIGAGFDQNVREFDITVLCGCVQGGPAAMLPGVAIGSGIQEKFRHRDGAARRRGVKRHVPRYVSRARIYLRSFIEQRARCVDMSEMCGQMQWEPPIRADGVHKRAVAREQFFDFLEVAEYRRGEDCQGGIGRYQSVRTLAVAGSKGCVEWLHTGSA